FKTEKEMTDYVTRNLTEDTTKTDTSVIAIDTTNLESPIVENDELIPSNKREERYLRRLRRKRENRQRLITLDKSDITFSRQNRTPEATLQNPANLGIKAEALGNFSLIFSPWPNIGLDVYNSSFSINTVNTYFNDGRTLTQSELDEFVSLFKTSGLGVYSNVEIPTIFSLKLPMIFTTFHLNTGFFVNAKGVLPGEVLAIPFQGNRTPGLSFDNPLTDAKSDFEANVYLKNTIGVGSFAPIPDIKISKKNTSIGVPDIRFGLNINLYSGLFANIQGRNITISVDEETGDSFGMDLIITAPLDSLSIMAGDTLSDLTIAPPEFNNPSDVLDFIHFSPGIDFGVGMRFALNDYIPLDIPKFFKNELDVQLSFRDIGAKIKVNNMMQKKISVEGNYLDPLNIDMDSMLVVSETTIDSNATITKNIASKMDMIFTYQPIDQIYLQSGFTAFIGEGIGHEVKSRLFFDVKLFPAKWFFLNYRVERIEYNKHFKTGFGFCSRSWDMAFYLHGVNQIFLVGYDNWSFEDIKPSDFSAGENMRGLGISFKSNWYF
ncbi:MAG: hypothetical protein U9N76_05545, partial [Candidatus Marinimicrobia bacterium]|nr:hypothetical protein [Candidatus Neomarinimicrobiota bacterium]